MSFRCLVKMPIHGIYGGYVRTMCRPLGWLHRPLTD